MAPFQYKYLRVAHDKGGIYCFCSDPNYLGNLHQALQTISPKCKLTSFNDGTPGRFHELGGRDAFVYQWLLKHLTTSGWEPFAVTTYWDGNAMGIYNALVNGTFDVVHFRLFDNI